MRKALHILSLLLLTALLPAGCARDVLEVEKPQLKVRIRIPSGTEDTKTVDPSSAELRINNLRLWVFLAEDAGGKPAGTCLGYLNPDKAQISREGTQEFSFKLEEAVAKAKPKVNVYALANQGSTGLNVNQLTSATTQAFLDEVVLGENRFGVQSPVTAVPSGGIPYTACGKNIVLSGTFPVLEAGLFTLTRVVSKIHVVLCQAVDEAGTMEAFSVQSITLNEGQIPLRENLFNETSAPKISPEYHSTALSFPVPSPIAQNPECDTYVYKSTMGDQEYENLINAGISQGVLSDCGVYYLKESDKCLTGTITYTVGTEAPKSVNFSMKTGENFSRNHDWIVYLYFIGDAIEFSVSWTEWTNGGNYYLTPDD